MFDKNTLSQLTQLKDEIISSKEYGEGTVATTNGKFGFIRLDDGRDAFLNPEKMQKLLPGDRVKALLITNDKGKLEADVENILESTLDFFVGEYHIKGAGHFIVPIDPKHNRWIFVPPKERLNCKENDIATAQVIRHPKNDGRAQAKVIEKIGQPHDNYYEKKYISAKYKLNFKLNSDSEKHINEIEQQVIAQEYGSRTDLTQVNFVTIDSEMTRDMDDALAIEKNGDTFKLHVAIADPSYFIKAESALDRLAFKNAQTVYMHCGSVPMLPRNLSINGFSLAQAEDKCALICDITLSAKGEIQHYTFSKGLINSKSKLSYNQVAAFLKGEHSETPITESLHDTIKTLSDFCHARIQYRKEHHLLTQIDNDYEYQYDEKGKIKGSLIRERNHAHCIVEEAMVLTNICAGEFLSQHNTGIFLSNIGIRPERLGEAKSLLKDNNIEYNKDITSVEGFTELMHVLDKHESQSYLIHPLRRMMSFSHISNKPLPHLSIGFQHYAHVTSPIRRYADLYNHQQLSNILNEQKVQPISQENLSLIQERLDHGRQADNELHKWLTVQYASTLIDQEDFGKIRIVTQQGFGVRLENSGVDGFVLFDKKQEKSFDTKRMTITVNDITYKLNDRVKVKVKSVDNNKKRIALNIA